MAYSALLLRSNFYTLPVSPDGRVLGEAVPLTRGNSRHTRPAFSADGERLAYDHWSLGKNSDIWAMDADGSNAVQVTVDPGSDSVSTWFPDGERLAYLRRRADRRLVRAVDLESGEEETLATLEVDADWARLSPDGTRLAYHTRAGDISFNIRILDLATGRRRQLTFEESLAGFPCWSSDSRWIAFQVERGGDRHLQVLPSDGSAEPVTLVGGSGQSWAYSFSPDSDKVAFVSDRDGFWNIYWTSRSTGEERRLTHYDLLSTYVRYPAWSPRGDSMVFELAESAGDIFVAEREED
jgi:TolB protein